MSETGYSKEQNERPSHRVWRLAGFDAHGVLVEIEFREPGSETGATPQRPYVVLGRDPANCDHPVQEPTVSRAHARLKYIPGMGLCIRDLDSTNGTFVDGTAVHGEYVPLKGGGEVELGQFILAISVRQ